MTTTTTYRDQHTPAKAGFFTAEFLIGMNEIAAYPLERLQIESTKQALLVEPQQADAFRQRAKRAGAARMAISVVDEFLIDNGGEYEV